VAAAFRLHLILDVHAGGPGRGELDHGARDHEGRPEARVGVHQQGQIADGRYSAHVLDDIVEGGQAQVGEPE
jgi:hypothetical protein